VFRIIEKTLTLLLMAPFACLAFPTGGSSASDQQDIQLITWRGMTPAEQGFLSRLAELGLQAKYDHFDAGRSETKLAGFFAPTGPNWKKGPHLHLWNHSNPDPSKTLTWWGFRQFSI
jgi:hypothetical protein